MLDILVQSRGNKAAAKQFFRKLGCHLDEGCQSVPRVLITEKLASYGAAKREILKGVEHRQHKRLNSAVDASIWQAALRSRRVPG